MRIFDRYLIKNISHSYIFISLVFIGLYFIIDLFSSLSDILESKPSFLIIIQYYLYSMPLIILRVSPLALLISTLYTFGELNKNNEIISVRASGLSILRVAAPAVFFALFISIFTFFIQEKTLLYSQRKVEEIKERFLNKQTDTKIEEKNIAFTSGNMIIFSETFSPSQKTLKNVMIFQEDKNQTIFKKIICKKIMFKDNAWIGKNVSEYNIDAQGELLNIPVNSKTKKIDLKEKPKELLSKKSIFSQYYSLNTLRKEIRRLKQIKAGSFLSNLIIDYYQKMAEPFSHLFLIIGILPLALEIKKRKVALSSLGVGFIFGFIYYSFFSFSIALGKSGLIIPFFSAWLAPLFFLTIGITGLLLIK